MQITHPHTLLILAWLAIGQLCIGCSAEDIAVEQSNTGVLRLQMSSNQHYIDIETRASVPLTSWDGYTITLKQGVQAVDATFDNGVAILEAGTYTLSVTNESEQYTAYSGPIYSGSTDVIIETGKQTDVTLDLGKPKNAKVTLSLSEVFSAKYELSSMTFTDGNVTSSLTPSNTTAYFPASVSQLTYTLVANAKAGSHVQDITSATGTIAISAGTHTPITLNLNPIDPNLVIIETGTEYGGEFQ